jgi:hypothetical protein
MPLDITLDLFSGRPNPTFRIPDRAAAKLLDRLKPAEPLPRAQAQAGPPPMLGYRGIIIEQSRASRGLPRRFRVVAGSIFGDDQPGRGPAHAITDPEAEFELLKRPEIIRQLKARPLTPNALKRLALQRAKLKWPGRLVFPIRKVCSCGPVYEPAWWNDGGPRQWGNNCYNYGTNHRTDTFAQPGRASGAMYTSPIAGGPVKAGAVADALEDWPAANNKCPTSGHLVALVIWPGVDFHWYRKGTNGRWTHKPGGTQATNLDNSGNLITDPRTANRGNYTQFTTFMIARHGHTKIN